MTQPKQQLLIPLLVVLGFCGLGGLGLMLPGVLAKASQSAAKNLIPGEQHTSQHLWLVPGSIDDGKTLTITDGTQETQLQLCGVAIPETDQLMAMEARDHLRELIAVGNGAVIVVPIKKNRSGQMLADVFITKSADEEIHLNSQMILDGMASVDDQKAGQCPQADVLVRAEEMAKER